MTQRADDAALVSVPKQLIERLLAAHLQSTVDWGAMKELRQVSIASVSATRASGDAVATALKAVLDDWANANEVGTDTRQDAECALDTYYAAPETARLEPTAVKRFTQNGSAMIETFKATPDEPRDAPLVPQGDWVRSSDYDALLKSPPEVDASISEDIKSLVAIASREAAARVEANANADRLRAGLQWYADGHHYDLPDWEDCSGESPNWIFPPIDEPPGDKPWMVDNGGVAKAVLNGDWLNPNHEDTDAITIVGQIATKEQHESMLARIEELMPDDPHPDTLAGKELMLLARLVEQYEKRAYMNSVPQGDSDGRP